MAAAAQRRRLQDELIEAQEELNETYRDREYDNTVKALDKEAEAYEDKVNEQKEALDESLKDTANIVTESLATVRSNGEAILSELVDLSKTYGIELSNEITTPWKNGEAAISAYSESFKNLKDSFAEELNYLIEQEKILQQEADKAAQSVLNSLARNETKVESATNPAGAQKDYQLGSYNGSANSSPKQQTSSKAGTVSNLPGYIQSGQSGSNVRILQQALNELGFNAGTVDGVFGPNTAAAVRRFQSSSKYGGAISADGIVGPDTKRKFKAAGYAKGTLGTKKDELAWVDELGEELVLHAGKDGKLEFMTKGTSVIPADLTSKLMDMALDPTQTLENSRPVISAPKIVNNNINVDMKFGSVVNIEHVDNETVPDVTKAVEKQMDKYMKGLNQQIRKFAR